MTRWFEDIVTGESFQLGGHTFTAEEIVAFATTYDPQYFHVDPAAAAHSHFGGLIASGWHTVVVGHRKMVDALFAEEERIRGLGREPGVSGPSPGVNSMDFKAPVRPGDTVTYTLIVTGKRASASIPGWGLLFNRLEAVNQHGEIVYRAEIVGFSKLRDYKMPLRLAILTALTNLPGLGKLLRPRELSHRMRFYAALALAILAILATPAAAQDLTGAGVEGNWGCRAIIDGTRAGLLTVYAGSYGYASANYGSAASGSGTAEMAPSGITFLDGNLPTSAGIINGVLGFDASGRDTLTLNTPDKPVLTCTPR